MTALLLLGATLGASAGVGDWILAALRPRDLHGTLRLVLALALGLGLVSAITLAAGLAGVMTPAVGRALCVLLFVIGALRLRISKGLRRPRLTGMSPVEVAICGALAVLVTANVLAALAPPTSGDILTYHLALPKLYAEAGRIYYLPYFEANQPLGWHMLSVWALSIADDRTAILLANVVPGVLLLLTIVTLGRRVFGRTTALLAGLIFYVTPMVTEVSSGGSIELGLTLLLFLAFTAIVTAGETGDATWVVVAGLLCGLAAGAKLTGLMAVPALAVVFFALAGVGDISWRRALGWSVVFGLVMGTVALPWYVKNLLWTGNPVFPAFYSVFGGVDWSAGMDAVIAQKMKAAAGQGRGWLALVMLPWNITMHGERFNAGLQGYGPIFLASVPAVIFLAYDRGTRRLMTAGAVFSTTFGLLWFFLLLQRGRHLLPIVPFLSLAAAAGLVAMMRRGPALTAAAAVALSVHLGFCGAVSTIFNAQFISVVAGLETREAFLTRKIPTYVDVRWLNDHLPDDSRLLHLQPGFNYYLDVQYFWASMLSQGHLDWTALGSVEELVAKMSAMGVTHVYLDQRQLDEQLYSIEPGTPLAYHVQQLLRGLQTGYLEEVYRSDRRRPSRRSLGRELQEYRARVYRFHREGWPSTLDES